MLSTCIVFLINRVAKYILLTWKVEDEQNKISDPDRTTVKANIVNLMLRSPEQIQKQVWLWLYFVFGFKELSLVHLK